MSIAESLLVLGTCGICTGVWVTLAVIINQNRRVYLTALKNARPKKESK